MKIEKTIKNVVFYIVLIAIMILMVIPFIWMFTVSVGRVSDMFVVPPHWIPVKFQLTSYFRVFKETEFPKWFLNSLQIASSITIGRLFVCSTAAYAFSRLRFPGRDILFFVMLSALMVPTQVTIIPVFIIMRYLKLIDNPLALILPGLISPFGVFLLRQFFMTIPTDLEDSAKIDGANPLLIYWKVILPLGGGALATLAILTFNTYWNDFFVPLIFLNSGEKLTLPLGIGTMIGRFSSGSGLGSDPSGIVAVVTMSIIPVLIIFLFAQRYLIESITMTGIKE
jgi:multiple sugar transport system permease protein